MFTFNVFTLSDLERKAGEEHDQDHTMSQESEGDTSFSDFLL